MKNILFSTTSFDTIDNGPALFANILSNSKLLNNNYDFRIISEDLNSPRRKAYKLNLNYNKFNSFIYQFLRIFKYHKIAKKILNEFDFDVLIYNNAFTGLLCTLFLKKRVVVMINDDNKLYYKKISFKFNKKYFKTKILGYFERVAVINADTVIVNSLFMKKQVSLHYGLKEDKTKLLIKGIDLEKYKFRIREKFTSEIEILFIKADYVRGGLFDLIEAITLLQNSKIKITIIGPPLDQINLIKKKINNRGIAKYEINGPLHPNSVKQYFERADIFCVPAHKEALGVANMEALASGIPVISTNVGGVPEVLDYGNCGWLVEPGNPMKIAESLAECINNDNIRIKKSKKGIKYVQKFDSKKLVSNFINIIDNGKRQDKE